MEIEQNMKDIYEEDCDIIEEPQSFGTLQVPEIGGSDSLENLKVSPSNVSILLQPNMIEDDEIIGLVDVNDDLNVDVFGQFPMNGSILVPGFIDESIPISDDMNDDISYKIGVPEIPEPDSFLIDSESTKLFTQEYLISIIRKN